MFTLYYLTILLCFNYISVCVKFHIQKISLRRISQKCVVTWVMFINKMLNEKLWVLKKLYIKLNIPKY